MQEMELIVPCGGKLLLNFSFIHMCATCFKLLITSGVVQLFLRNAYGLCCFSADYNFTYHTETGVWAALL